MWCDSGIEYGWILDKIFYVTYWWQRYGKEKYCMWYWSLLWILSINIIDRKWAEHFKDSLLYKYFIETANVTVMKYWGYTLTDGSDHWDEIFGIIL